MSSSKAQTRPNKRRRVFAQPFEDEENLLTPKGQAEAPSASAFSTRVLPETQIPPLTTLCIRVFADNLRKLSQDTNIWESVRSYLKVLPDSLITRVFTALRITSPSLLNHAVIAAHFLRGDAIVLDRSMPGVRRATIAAIADSPFKMTLRELVLTGFDKENDTVFASVVSQLPAVHVLVLRGV